MFNRARKKVNINRQTGAKGEEFAVTYLKNKGFKIKERNFRTRWGEIDIIAQKGEHTHFVEVKTRTTNDYGHPLESLPFYRVERLKKMALWYATRFKLTENRLHLSLLGISWGPQDPKVFFVEDIIS
ncbi:MAG: YraN family protein [Deltaproteobacteria bacterium]|nr:YraN family protein [Deltaproteobacteria bacterium]